MTMHFWIGLVLFVVAGAMLAFGAEPWGTPVGTTFAIAGIGLLGWAWWCRQDRSPDDPED